MNLNGEQFKIISNVLKDLNYETSISSKIFYHKGNPSIYYYLRLDTGSHLRLVDNINYGKVNTGNGIERKIYNQINITSQDEEFMLPSDIVEKISPNVYFSAPKDLQEKLINKYFEKLGEDISLNEYNFFKNFPGVDIVNFAQSIEEFFKKYSKEFEQVGIDLFFLNKSLNTLARGSYFSGEDLAKKIISFNRSQDFEGNIFVSSYTVSDTQIKDYLINFFTLIDNKLKTEHFSSWLTNVSEKLDAIFKLLNKEIYHLYKTNDSFADVLDNIKSKNILKDEAIKIIEAMNLDSETKEVDFFSVSNSPYSALICIEKRKFLEMIPSAILDFFKNDQKLLTLFKAGVEGSSNVIVREVIFNHMSRSDNSIVIKLESDSIIDENNIKDIIKETVREAFKYTKEKDLSQSLSDISINVFQNILSKENENSSKAKNKENIRKF